MKLNEACFNLVRKFEGLRLTSYRCPAGVWTIGYGHTGPVNGVPLGSGITITLELAEQLLVEDLTVFRDHVMTYDKIYHWNENELAALTSFAYNIGSIHQLTARGTRSRSEIAGRMPLYTKANGKILQGLIRRREAERDLFLQPLVEAKAAEQTGGVETITMLIRGNPVKVKRVLEDGVNYVKLRDLCVPLGLRVSNKGNIPVIE